MSTFHTGWSIAFVLVAIATLAIFTLPWVADGVRNSPPESAAISRPSPERAHKPSTGANMCYVPASPTYYKPEPAPAPKAVAAVPIVAPPEDCSEISGVDVSMWDGEFVEFGAKL